MLLVLAFIAEGFYQATFGEPFFGYGLIVFVWIFAVICSIMSIDYQANEIVKKFEAVRAVKETVKNGEKRIAILDDNKIVKQHKNLLIKRINKLSPQKPYNLEFLETKLDEENLPYTIWQVEMKNSPLFFAKVFQAGGVELPLTANPLEDEE